MKKIILTIILSSFLSAIAVADDHVMRNVNPNAPLMSGKHMMNTSPNAPLMSGKHMMNTNSSRSSSKDDAGASNIKKQVNKGYTVIPYKKNLSFSVTKDHFGSLNKSMVIVYGHGFTH